MVARLIKFGGHWREGLTRPTPDMVLRCLQPHRCVDATGSRSALYYQKTTLQLLSRPSGRKGQAATRLDDLGGLHAYLLSHPGQRH